MDLFEARYPVTNEERAISDDLRSRISVAQALVRQRIQYGLTQAELGERAGTKQSRVSEIEAMKGNPRFDTLDRIARVVGLMVTLVPRPGSTFALPKQIETIRTGQEWRASGNDIAVATAYGSSQVVTAGMG